MSLTVKSMRMWIMAASVIVAMPWLGSSVVVHAAEGSAAPERHGKAIPVSADLTHDLERLEKRGTQSDVYDLFSRPAPSSSSARAKGQARGKGAHPVRPSETDPSEVEEIVAAPVVVAPPAVQTPVPPIAAPVVAPPPPPPPGRCT